MGGKVEMTAEAQASHLSTINQATLTPLVQSASNTIEVICWDYEQLHGGAGGGTIYRFTGQGSGPGLNISWSLILKVFRPGNDDIDISDWNYYKREVDAYQSGWFDDLPGNLAVPRSFAAVEHPDGICWIWLEDITDEIGSQWPLEHYGIVARHLGRFNGAYLTGRELPSWPWLSSGWLRKYVARNASALPLLQNSLMHPLVCRWLPGDFADNLLRLWGERGLFLKALDRLPQTLCHHDAFRRNLFAQRPVAGDVQTVVIDWAFCGQGAIGEELVPLIQADLFFFEVDLAQAKMLEEIVFAGYISGLREAGWQGDPRQVRLGYTAAASLRYNFGEMGRILAVILDETRHPGFQRVFGHSIEETLDRWGALNLSFVGLIDEARSLINTITRDDE
ncbi:MAG: phosphotransferase [Deltaproteobacteria bacterium]|nr:phosphotransferase [Candidatus Tharpella aukensis]